MRALYSDRYGSAQTLRLVDMPKPRPGPGEVLVRVHAAALNSWDWDRLVGNAMARVLEPLRPTHKIPGADLAGVVEALGEGTEGFAVGDAVFGDFSESRWGAFAEYACGSAAALAPVPEGLGFIDAAALPQAGALALQGLRQWEPTAAGRSVLVNGAGGGVGTFAIQLAKQQGATVTAVDKGEKREGVLALGADAFIDYRTVDFTAGDAQYDLVIDVVASRSARRFAGTLRQDGRLVVIGGTVRSLLSVACLGPVIGRIKGKRLGLLMYRVSPQDFSELAQRCVEGRLRPVLDSVHPLDRARDAFERLGGGMATGKVILSMV